MCSEVDFNLPSEVLEMVFSHVPLVHLLTVDATVCRYWYTVILNPAFIPWRKVHHRLKLAPWRVPFNMPLHHEWESEKLPTIHIISTHCQHHGFTSVRDCIPSVINVGGRVGRGEGRRPAASPTLFSHVYYCHRGLLLLSYPSDLLHRSLPFSKKVVKIDAFAGAGKTTTLRRLCQERPHTRFLLLLPSVTLAGQCSQTFPINVTVTTAESLALSHIGTQFSSINKLEGTVGLHDIAKIMLSNHLIFSYKTLDLVRRTVNCFVSSSNEYITLQHVRNDTLNRREIETVTDKYQYEILSIAESVWKEMNRCSVRQKISMTQDGLVKAWQLTKPRIQGYDVLLVDGAEDISDAVLDIILNQHCAKVVIRLSSNSGFNLIDAVPSWATDPSSAASKTCAMTFTRKHVIIRPSLPL
ncbi:F-box DNA helicase 1-like [Procambarus clarkii]|uniref:F-box DNA helicase 1-like n=1 Tax=Procambarus clarkii TaxID=6728 RepID=UPI00374314D4